MHYTSHKTGLKTTFEKGRLIGNGLYGSVGNIKGQPEFVYKEILLNPRPTDWISCTRELRIKEVYRELWALKKLNLLEGYIRDNDKIIIIMRKLPGVLEHTPSPNPNFDPKNPNTPLQLFFFYSAPSIDDASASYKALLKINDQGVYHLDCHPANFLINKGPNGKSVGHVIDFGNATYYSLFNYFGQIGKFLQSRAANNFLGQTAQLVQMIQSENNNFKKTHLLQTILSYLNSEVAYMITAAVVFGPQSHLLFQVLRSAFMKEMILSIRSILDELDRIYSASLDLGTYTPAQLQIWKASIQMGYILLNAYSMFNIYSTIKTLKQNLVLKELIDHLGTIDTSSFSTVYASSMNACHTLTTNLLSILTNNPQNAFSFDKTGLDKTAAELLRLFSHLRDALGSSGSLFEKMLPVNALLQVADFQYGGEYRPAVLFRKAKQKASKCIYGAEPQPQVAGLR